MRLQTAHRAAGVQDPAPGIGPGPAGPAGRAHGPSPSRRSGGTAVPARRRALGLGALRLAVHRAETLLGTSNSLRLRLPVAHWHDDDDMARPRRPRRAAPASGPRPGPAGLPVAAVRASLTGAACQ